MKYKIIIPKEEICSFCDGTGQVVSCTTISRFKTCDCKIIPKEEPKQETFVNEKCFKCGRSQYSSGKPFCTDDFCNKNFYQKPKQESLSWDELVREVGSEEELIEILKLPHITPLIREAMLNNCKK